MWREEAVMTALSAQGEQCLCWASWNRLCAHVQFYLGLGQSTAVLWLTLPKSLLVNSENWNSLLDPLQTLNPCAGKESSHLEWKECLHQKQNKTKPFLGVATVPVPLTLSMMKSGKRGCCVTPKCGAERKEWGLPLRLCPHLPVHAGTGNPGKSFFNLHGLKNSKQTKGFLSQCLLGGF